MGDHIRGCPGATGSGAVKAALLLYRVTGFCQGERAFCTIKQPTWRSYRARSDQKEKRYYFVVMQIFPDTLPRVRAGPSPALWKDGPWS